MITDLAKIPQYILLRKFKWPKVLPGILTLSITDWCNSRCKTCNIWQMRPKNELTLDEYDKIFNNYGKTFWITVTGGEPFLNLEIADIIKLVYRKTKPNYITIPSHGMFTDKILETVNEVLRSCPNLNLVVNLSLDGIEEQHDFIRGVPGNFEKTTTTFSELKKINNKRLTLGINSVISRFNVSNFPDIYEKILEMQPDSYVSEVAENRANLYNEDLKITPNGSEYGKALWYIINDLKQRKRDNTPELIRKLRIEFYKSLANGKFPTNYEGLASAYVMASGEVWISHSKRYVIGNLRDVNYDFRELWFNKKAWKLRRFMEKTNYSSMLANGFYTNVMCNPIKLLKVLMN